MSINELKKLLKKIELKNEITDLSSINKCISIGKRKKERIIYTEEVLSCDDYSEHVDSDESYDPTMD